MDGSFTFVLEGLGTVEYANQHLCIFDHKKETLAFYSTFTGWLAIPMKTLTSTAITKLADSPREIKCKTQPANKQTPAQQTSSARKKAIYL